MLQQADTLEELRPDAFQAKLMAGDYDVIVDVRRRDDEWNLGHIPEATLIENLSLYSPGSSDNRGTPSDLAGCEYCEIIVYCRTGARAGRAISVLRANGFEGRMYNGQGTSQWTGKPYNYDLVTTDSVVPPCTVNQTVSEQCYTEWLARTGNTTGDGTEEDGAPSPGNGTIGEDTKSPTLLPSGGREHTPIVSWLVLAGVIFLGFSY